MALTKAHNRMIDSASVSIVDYGAVADWDGSSGTDNSTAIQAALDSGAGEVLFPDGVYYCASTLVVSTNGQRLHFQGNAELATDQNTALVKITTDNIVWEGGRLTQDNGSYEGTGLLIMAGIDAVTSNDNGNLNNIVVRDIRVNNFQNGIKLRANGDGVTGQRGVAYASIRWRALIGNTVGIALQSEGTEGYVNSNEFLGYRITAQSRAGTACVLINNGGLACNANFFRGNFENTTDLLDFTDTGINNVVGLEFEGYFENVNKPDSISMANEIYLRDWRNRHSVQEIYTGSRYTTTFITGDSNQEGGDFQFKRTLTTDASNTPRWTLQSTLGGDDRFAVNDDNHELVLSGVDFVHRAYSYSQTGGTIDIDLFNDNTTCAATIEVIATADTIDTAGWYYKGLITCRKDDANYSLQQISAVALGSGAVALSDDGGSPALVTATITAPNNRFYRYKVFITGNVNFA